MSLREKARSVWKAAKKAWPWLKWVIAGALLIAGIKMAARVTYDRMSMVRDKVAKPAKWQRVPGNQTYVMVQDPDTGKLETVELPPGVKARTVKTVGIAKSGDAYEVEILHSPTDRRGPAVADSSMEL